MRAGTGNETKNIINKHNKFIKKYKQTLNVYVINEQLKSKQHPNDSSVQGKG